MHRPIYAAVQTMPEPKLFNIAVFISLYQQLWGLEFQPSNLVPATAKAPGDVPLKLSHQDPNLGLCDLTGIRARGVVTVAPSLRLTA